MSDGCEMFIDKITTAERQLLYVKSEKTTKLYEWFSGAWEPIESTDVDAIVVSEQAHVHGILISD